MILMESNRNQIKKWKKEMFYVWRERKKNKKIRLNFFGNTYPNWFCKTGYAVLNPAAAAAANGNP